VGNLRRWLRHIERDSEVGVAYISQIDGPPVRVSNEAMREAWAASVARLVGKDVPEHWVSRAARRSPDPDWHNNLVARAHLIGEKPEDLSE
jgi:hypothetical protein